jgi:Arc/MetJ-type ribon-helix-helix transcriptional regulator
MSRHTSTMTISLPEDLKQFVKKRSRTAHFGTPSDYIRGLIREDLQRLEQERLEIELMKGLKGKQRDSDDQGCLEAAQGRGCETFQDSSSCLTLGLCAVS